MICKRYILGTFWAESSAPALAYQDVRRASVPAHHPELHSNEKFLRRAA